MSLAAIGSFAGGIGLFLLGMRLMTDGLKLAAGQALRDILGQWTRTPLRGLFAGVLITAMVQSSSAVTVATIGFVNAGLLNLFQTIGVIYGSNIGTTMTGWLVALVGFKLDVQALALPLIGGGMLLQLTGSGSRRGAIGEALAGFGLFFLGIAILKGAFEGLGASLPLADYANAGVLSVLLFVGIGFLLTFLMQSSSAAIAITLTAAAGGVIPLNAAAAVVIGANVGTTSTAALAVIGATSNAQRVAAAHVLFNLITGLVALLLLPLMLSITEAVRGAMHLQGGEVTTLALFHTVFNILGVLIMWPITPRLVRFLEKRFRRIEEDLGQPRFLDKNVVGMPPLALDALTFELERIGDIARDMAKGALSAEAVPGKRLAADKQAVDALVEAVEQFSVQMQRADLPEDISEALPAAIRVGRYYAEVAEMALAVAETQQALPYVEDETLAARMAHFRSECVHLLENANPSREEYADAASADQQAALESEYHDLKGQLLRAGAQDKIKVRQMVGELDQYSSIRRMIDQAVKGARYLSGLLHVAGAYRREREAETAEEAAE